MRARIYRSAMRSFDCRLTETHEIVEATALGNLVKRKEGLVVGDYVELSHVPETGEYQITSVEERKNEISRMLVREGKKKVTAANCDVMVIVMTGSKPVYKRGLVDRYLVRAFQWEIYPVLVFNKMDQFEQSDELDLRFEKLRLEELGVRCFEISAADPHYRPLYLEEGLAELKELLTQKTSIFLGQSGVGKSHLITTLSEGKVELLSKELAKVGKGAHTTTWSEIVDCGDFEVIDSPGIRSFSLDDVPVEELDDYFPDVQERAVHCRFKNCEHSGEASGCAFAQLDPEKTEDAARLSRLDSYLRLKEELGRIPSWQKKS